MNTDKAHRWVIGAWVGMLAMISLHQMTGPDHKSGEWPSPGAYVGSAVLFSIYWLVATIPDGARFAAVLALGTDLGALVMPYINPPQQAGAGTTVLTELQKWMNQISGSTGGGSVVQAENAPPPPQQNPNAGTQPFGPSGRSSLNTGVTSGT